MNYLTNTSHAQRGKHVNTELSATLEAFLNIAHEINALLS